MPFSSAIARIYQEQRQALYSLALGILRDPGAAEDAVHDAVSRVLIRTREPEGDPAAFLFTCARNAALDAARRRKVRAAAPVDGSIFDSSRVDPSMSAADAEAFEQLRSAIDELPQEQQEVLLMRALGRLGFEQIATVTGLPLGTVASRYSRGVQALRNRLQEVQS